MVPLSGTSPGAREMWSTPPRRRSTRAERLALGLVLACLGGGGCRCTSHSPGGTMTAESPSTTGTDADSLAKLVTLSRTPQTVRWRKSLLGEPGLGPTDWKLTAVIELSAADADALAASLKPL